MLLDHPTFMPKAVMQRPIRLKLSLAGTAAVALASLPLAVTPASAYKLSQGTATSISAMPSNTLSNASIMHFNAGLQNSHNVIAVTSLPYLEATNRRVAMVVTSALAGLQGFMQGIGASVAAIWGF